MIAPYFSIIIPVYNSEKFIKRTIASVLNQTFSDYEVVIVDNCSVDSTKEIIFSFNDSRIQYHTIVNKGVIAKSRNLGITKSKGLWVVFLDSDDLMYINKLETIKKFIDQNTNYILFSHQVNIIKDNKIIRVSKNLLPVEQSNLFSHLLLRGNPFITSAVIVKKQILDLVGGFDETSDFITAEDFELWTRLSQYGQFYFVDEILGEYLIHDSNNLKNYEQSGKAQIAVITHFLERLDSIKDKKFIETVYANICYYGALAFYRAKLYHDTRDYILKSLRKLPLRFRSWILLVLSIFKIDIKI